MFKCIRLLDLCANKAGQATTLNNVIRVVVKNNPFKQYSLLSILDWPPFQQNNLLLLIMINFSRTFLFLKN